MVILAIAASPARAADDAAQLTGLFAQTCLAYAGDPAGLRAWIARTGLRPLPPEGQSAFLHGTPGTAFDATNTAGKFVLLAPADGSCAAIAEHGDPKEVVRLLESTLGAAAITFQVVNVLDKQAPGVLDRTYRAAKGARHWLLTASVVPGDSGGHAMLWARSE